MKNIQRIFLLQIFLYPYLLAAQSTTNNCFPQNSALINALFGTDRTAAIQAAACLPATLFAKNDLPLLHEALLKRPSPQTGLMIWEVHDVIRNRVIAINDSSSFRFAAAHYRNIVDSDDFIKGSLLRIMAHFPNATHYKEMADLLQASPPRKMPFEIFLEFQQNLHTTVAIMPQLLYLLNDSLARPFIADIAGMMINRNMLTAATIHPWQQAILKYANDEVAFLSTDYGVPRSFDYALIGLLGLLETPAANAARKRLRTLVQQIKKHQ